MIRCFDWQAEEQHATAIRLEFDLLAMARSRADFTPVFLPASETVSPGQK